MNRTDILTPARAALLIGALTLARLIFLWLSPLGLDADEAQYWEWSRGFDFGYFSKPPLLAWLIGATTAICGNGEACIRSFAPLAYAGTASAVYLLARDLYDERVGAWSALTVATIPGVSFSAIIASTDVPLLLCWAWALVALVRLLRGGGAWAAVALGCAIGVGALAKYAALYFIGCAIVLAIVDPAARRVLLGRHGALALAVMAALLAPNVLWNFEHGFATIRHTAALANADPRRFSPLSPLEFIGGQFGIFGPLLFAALLAWGWRPREAGGRLLACFVWPPLILMLAVAIYSRAHPNWAAVSYIAATPLVVAVLRDSRWLRATVVIHGAAAVIAYALIAGGGGVGPRMLGLRDPTDRLRGFAEFARQVATLAPPGATILLDNRTSASQLIYYLRGRGFDLSYWHDGGPVENHFQMSRPFLGEQGRPIVYLATSVAESVILARFATQEQIARILVPQGPGGVLVGRMWRVEGFRPG